MPEHTPPPSAVEGFCSICPVSMEQEGDAPSCQECIRYRDLYVNAPLGIFQCDGERRFLNVNPQLAFLYGFESPEQFLANVTYVTERLQLREEELQDALGTLQREGVIHNYEVQLQRKDGSLLWTTHSIRTVTATDGSIIFYDGFVTDISEKKELEKLRDDVARMTRHDMKSPLLSIVAAARLLNKRLTLEGEEAEMLQDIHDKGAQVLEMINTSLDLFKMEQRDYQPRFEPFDMAALARSVGRSMLPAYEEKRLRFEVVVDGPEKDAERCEFEGEERHIETMLMNLVKNALEAAPEGSTITVRLNRNETFCELDVHNLGAIPQDIRPRFFQRYSTSGKPEGLGLGAYSARLITEAHGGSISYKTSEEDGTHIQVKLPCRQPKK
ncbi:PAS domain-containing sensor histidine kinase [Oceanidesulfovibrio marinus]|uniref:histidine kinase n=1 Tax=Oceanidesulfovibrio marinus TaxID=370038 RepID=A0ABX6NDI8_9BACT|nr:PAS domain-containing sensor histidine kinase [Oceanidesulfovibrio marinus]QJT07820.1 PAS domain S-box protein [Oceanidesulfovibrio marinus]